MPDILGIDVSANNATTPIDWSKLPKDKVRFAIIKATEGATYEDPWFDRHWTSAHAQGIVCGAYHFYRSNRTGQQQADNIVKHILRDGHFGAGDLPVAIDVEEFKSVSSPATARAYMKELMACVKAVEAAMGAKPLIYTAGYVWTALGNPTDLADYPLWIANPTTAAAPTLPAPFTSYALWQYSFKGSMAGIQGAVDLDKFNGTEADFQNLLLK
jgi:lysozyme